MSFARTSIWFSGALMRSSWQQGRLYVRLRPLDPVLSVLPSPLLSLSLSLSVCVCVGGGGGGGGGGKSPPGALS